MLATFARSIRAAMIPKAPPIAPINGSDSDGGISFWA